MAYKISWSPLAVEDLESIAEYIARDSEAYAADTINALFNVAENLTEFPGKGRIVPEINDPAIREIILGNYRVMYRVGREAVTVAAVIHGARLLSNALRGRPM